MADLHNRDQVLLKTVLVINLEVKDNHEEAAVGARLALDLCEQVLVMLCFGCFVMLDISLTALYVGYFLFFHMIFMLRLKPLSRGRIQLMIF